jgi:ATP-dependent DNA ligase
VFDIPSLNEPFEARYAHLKSFLDGVPYTTVVEHTRCEGAHHVREYLREIEEQGGEGVMLRQPGSMYAHTRSSSLLKVKTFHDAEARVTGYEGGKGRHDGRVGALQMEMACGKTFKVGTGLTDRQREKPPAIGSIVTYRFQELTASGVPRFPVFVGVRIDLDEPADPRL